MSITASRTIQRSFSGDVTESIIQSAADNVTSVKKDDLITLLAGNNTLTAPVVTGFTVTGLEIFPPAGNATVITVKGINTDQGFPIHITDPFSIGLDSTFVSLVLSVGVQINGVRVIWS